MKRLVLILLGIATLVLGVSAIWFLSTNKNLVTPGDVQTPVQLVSPDAALDVETKPEILASNIPAGIHRAQIKHVTGEKFALVSRPSLNVYLEKLPTDFKAEFAGVLAWDEMESQWNKWLRIEDLQPDISGNNNPVSLEWVDIGGDTQAPVLTVVDSNGAGSGEGMAKVLQPTSVDMETWRVIDCYYWSSGERVENSHLTFKLSDPVCQTVKVSYAGD